MESRSSAPGSQADRRVVGVRLRTECAEAVFQRAVVEEYVLFPRAGGLEKISAPADVADRARIDAVERDAAASGCAQPVHGVLHAALHVGADHRAADRQLVARAAVEQDRIDARPLGRPESLGDEGAARADQKHEIVRRSFCQLVKRRNHAEGQALELQLGHKARDDMSAPDASGVIRLFENQDHGGFSHLKKTACRFFVIIQDARGEGQVFRENHAEILSLPARGASSTINITQKMNGRISP